MSFIFKYSFNLPIPWNLRTLKLFQVICIFFEIFIRMPLQYLSDVENHFQYLLNF